MGGQGVGQIQRWGRGVQTLKFHSLFAKVSHIPLNKWTMFVFPLKLFPGLISVGYSPAIINILLT